LRQGRDAHNDSQGSGADGLEKTHANVPSLNNEGILHFAQRQKPPGSAKGNYFV
jgi:hypothetical protein